MPTTNPDPQQALFIAFLVRHRKAIWKLCLRHEHGDRQSTASLVQEVGLALWRNFGRLRPEASFPQERRWVELRTRAVLYEHRQRQRHNLLVLGGSAPDIGIEPAVDEHLSFQMLLDSLSPTDRQIVDLRLAGYSSREIAAQTGLLPPTVDTRMHRIVRRLRRLVVLDERRFETQQQQ